MQRIIRKLGHIENDCITIAQVKSAAIVRLPFHLCTGPLFRIDDPDSNELQIWLRNRISVPHNADIPESITILYKHREAGPEYYLTDAMILNSRPELWPGQLEAIRTGKTEGIGPASPKNPGFRFLNEVIGAHQMIRLGPYVGSVGTEWPRLLPNKTILGRLLVEVLLITGDDAKINDDAVARLFGEIDQLPLSVTHLDTGELNDYSPEQLSSLKLAVRKLRSHAFYELRANAVTAMLHGDAIVATVLACAALEGVHGAFMRLALRKHVPGDSAKFNAFASTLLREQGFYSLVQLSVRVLMKDGERPTDEELEQCLAGVVIRNAIMHAGIRGTGKYKIRELTALELMDGYKGIMAVYSAFEAAVETREADEIAATTAQPSPDTK